MILKKINIKFSSFVLLFILLLSQVIWAEPTDLIKVEQCINENAVFMLEQTPDLAVGSVGGEWTVMNLARSGYDVPEDFYNRYYKLVEKYVQQKKGNLHKRKYTEYSRVILALTAIGKDPHNVAGYDLLKPLADYDKTTYQGINGAIFALIALDSGAYEMPYSSKAKVQATRELYVKTILDKQNPKDNGFSLAGENSDVDITAMVLQALAPYQENTDVSLVINKALEYLSKAQNADGSYSFRGGVANSESVAQVIIALTALGIDPNDKRFVKNGKSLMDNLLSYYHTGGGFFHTKKDGSTISVIDAIATDQAMIALIAYRNFYREKNHFYDMTDVKKIASTEKENNKQDIALGLVFIPEISVPNKHFNDIDASSYKEAILALARRRILNGVSEDIFAPEQSMTRAEFCAMIVRAMNLTAKGATINFNDVSKKDWYYDYIAIAYKNGVVKGKSVKTFDPNGIITRAEAAMMLYNCADLLALDKTITKSERNFYLPSYLDYASIPKWSRDALTFAVKYKLINSEKMEIKPTKYLTREELAFMTYQLLLAAGL